MEAVIRELTETCRNMAWDWTLEYQEIDNTYYAWAEGIGQGEWTEVKREPSPEEALKRLLAKVKEWKPPRSGEGR